MASDYPVKKETYIKILRDALVSKLLVMDQLLSLSELQENVILADKFDEPAFTDIMDKKGEQIDKLNQLDKGFELIYQNVNEELQTNKEQYKDEIITLQELIKNITDKSIAIQALEFRNRDKLELTFSRKRKDIKSSRALSKSATNYYKTMANQHEQKSYFYDTKN